MTTDTDKTVIRSRAAPGGAAPRSVTTRAIGPPLTAGAMGRALMAGAAGPALTNRAMGPALTTGAIIKNRFVLEESIGRGGMGTVFRARDLRKAEVQDRNPYVAIKVLNENFRQLPGALHALQRESRKAQKLAHPNIVTVYDFDREGTNVYMVMELLEGEPLDRLIKRTQDVGLGVRDTVHIMRGICQAMDYAHQHGIMHADFKPANAFLTKSGIAKVLDFGIARAVELKGHSGTQDITRFDPGTFAALTPTYAGCEVIEGQTPDPRDDVYAIACVTYELIAGSHPYNRLSASQAEKAHMTPDQPPGMWAWQWRALRRGLSLRREGRQQSAMQLLDGLTPFSGWLTLYMTFGIAAVATVSLTAEPISRQIDLFRQRGTVATLASADARRIEPILGPLKALEPARRASLFLHEDARAGLLKYYIERVNELVDASRGRYDYPAAESLIAELDGFLPDSRAVQEFREYLSSQKSAELHRLGNAFDLDLQRGWFIPAQSEQNIENVLAHLRAVDPDSRLLSDPRLPGAFAESAWQALEHDEPMLGGALASAGLAIAPHDAALTDLHDQAERALRDTRRAILSPPASAREPAASDGELQAQLEDGLDRPKLSLARAGTLLQMINQLRRDGAVGVKALEAKLEARLVHSAKALSATSGPDAAVTFAEGARALFPQSAKLRQTLTELLAAVAQSAATKRTAAIASGKNEVETLLAHPALDGSWDEALQHQLAQLGDYTPEIDSYVGEVKRRAAEIYIARAAELRSSKQLVDARVMLDRSHEYQPKLASGPSITPREAAQPAIEDALLADARAKEAIGERKPELAAYVSSLKQKLLTRAETNDVTSAETVLRVLRENLPADDRFMTRDAPKAIAQAYVRMAWKAVGNGELKSAVDLINRGRAVAPSVEPIATAQARYARYEALDEYLTGAAIPDVRRVREEISDLYAQDPNTAKIVVPILARNLASRLQATGDPQMAVRLSQAGSEIFGEGPPFHRD